MEKDEGAMLPRPFPRVTHSSLSEQSATAVLFAHLHPHYPPHCAVQNGTSSLVILGDSPMMSSRI